MNGKLLDLVRKIGNLDESVAAVRSAGKPIKPMRTAHDERKRIEHEAVHLSAKRRI